MGLETVAEVGGEGKLADYYLAALEYIDPALTPDSSLHEVLAAAAKRRDILAQASQPEIREELGALSEALQFIQRVHTANQKPSAIPDAPNDSAAPAEPPVEAEPPSPLLEANAEASISAAPNDEDKPDAFQQGLLDFDTNAPPVLAAEPKPVKAPIAEAATPPPPDPAPVVPTAKAVQPAPAPELEASSPSPKPDLTAPLRLPKDEEPSQPPSPPAAESPKVATPAVKRAAKPDAGKATKRSAAQRKHPISRPQNKHNGKSLREVMAQAQLEAAGLPQANTQQEQPVGVLNSRNHAKSRTLPEAQAWPIVLGMALIGWQAWLALFAGWTVTRFFVWPTPEYGYLINRSQAILLIGVALIISLVVAKVAWNYRKQTHRLLLLVHLSAVLIGMDLLAWWLAALDPNLAIPAPSYWFWVALVAGWLAASAVCWLHDVRGSRHAPE